MKRLITAAVAVALGAGAWLGIGVMRGERCWADQPVKNTCDVEQAAGILREAWQVKAEDYEMWWKVFAPGTLAPYDPDRAIKVAADEKGNVPDEVRFEVLNDLLESDKARGLAWGPGQLDRVTNPHISIWMLTVLGLAAADTDVVLARKYYDQAKQFVGKDGPEPRLMWNGKEDMDYALLAGFAGRIGSDEAEGWVAKLKAYAKEKGKNKGEVDDILAYRSQFVAKGSPALAEKLALELGKDAALHALAAATAEASLQDKDLARKMLAKIESMGGGSMGDWSYAQAALYVIVVLTPSEPKAMLELARGIKDNRYKPLAMGLIAPYLDTKAKSELLREAAAELSDDNHIASDFAC